ncbi:MAG TPA: hypothetical protein VLX61_01975 [Anaerolineales bacterium]|nr:hypothetical protein [Anaerolineales bacterium]
MSHLAPTESFEKEYKAQESLFKAQPAIVQRFLEAQAQQLAETFVQRGSRVHFSLPDRVIAESNGESVPLTVPQNLREQSAGSLRDRMSGNDVHFTFRERLTQLEQSPDHAVGVSAQLIRHTTAMHMIYNMLPSGRSVTYVPEEDEDVPTVPAGDLLEPASAITASTDAIAEEEKNEDGRGSLLVPYVAAARRFYLPQWVAFDEDDKLLVNSVNEAEAHIASMQRFLTVIFAARSLAPYMVADEEYQKKRYGMLGQLINQGRALARYQTRDIIHAIKERAAAQSLNRGLSLSLPYFDDQELKIDTYHFVVIPAGRIMFVPSFVVRAAREEQVKVDQDTRFDVSTRKHLLIELKMLEEAFTSVKE